MLKALLYVFVVMLLLGCSGHPNDEKMLQKFDEHRTELDRLVTMFQEDRGLGRVGDGFTRPSDPSIVGVDAQRIGLYRELCLAIEAPDCIEGYDNAFFKAVNSPVQPGQNKQHIYILVSTIGISVSGSSKGFLYSTDPKFPIVETLDEFPRGEPGTWLRKIEGDWYLYYQE